MAIVQIPFAYDLFYYKLISNAIRIDITRECPYIRIECPNLCNVDCATLKESNETKPLIHEGVDISSFPLVDDKPKIAPLKNLVGTSNQKIIQAKPVKRLANPPGKPNYTGFVRLAYYSTPFVVDGEHMMSANYDHTASACQLGFLKTFETEGEKNDAKQTQ